MALKTYREKERAIQKPVLLEKKETIKKQEAEPEEKAYWLRHPDFEAVKNLKYSLDGKSFDLNNEGCIIVYDLPTKDRLISQGFHYLGYKIEENAY
jgi:hypothetical protein